MHVEGDVLVYNAVTCAACGAKVREGRPRCLRCGRRLIAAETAPARQLPLGTLAAVALCLALVGIGVLFGGSASEGSPTPTAVVGANSEPAPLDGAQGAPSDSRGALASNADVEADPVVLALESRQAGAAAYERGDLATALEQFQLAVEAHPGDAEALNNLGQVLVRSGRVKEAIAQFDKAIAIAGDRWAYHFNRARAYAELKAWDRAVPGYRDAEALFPDDYATQFNLGRALLASGDTGAAAAAFARTVELAPGEPEFYLAHAGALDRAARSGDAAAAYRRYLELDPSAPQAEKIKARIAELEGVTIPVRP